MILALHSSRSVFIPLSVYRRFRDPLITAVVIYRQGHIKRERRKREEEVKEKERSPARLQTSSGQAQVDLARNRCIHTHTHARTQTHIHKSAPNYRFVAFFRPLFARSPVSRVLFFLIFILPAVPTKSAAFWTPVCYRGNFCACTLAGFWRVQTLGAALSPRKIKRATAQRKSGVYGSRDYAKASPSSLRSESKTSRGEIYMYIHKFTYQTVS